MNSFRILTGLCLSAMLGACSVNESASGSSWLTQIGGLGPEIVFDLAETSDGRLCATGTFYNEAEFGRAERAVTLSALHTQDIFLACFDHTGQLDKALQFGTRLGDEPRAIAALPGGDVVITGYFAHEFGAARSGATRASGSADVFLSRINPQGEEVWTRRFGGKLADNGAALAVDPEGNILLAGNFQDIITYPVGEKTRKLVSAGGRDAFVLKLDNEGNVLWGRSFGGPGRDEALRVTTGHDGRVLVAGVFEAEARLAGADHTRLIALGNADAYLLALEEDGEFAWSRHIAGRNREQVSGLVRDTAGNVYMAGGFLETIVLPDGRSLVSEGSNDIYLIRFDHEGALQWADRLGGKEIDEAFDLAISNYDELLLSGYFQGTSDFAPGPAEHRLTSSGVGNSDGFVLTLDTDGKVVTSLQAAGEGVEMAFAVTALGDGGMATAGLFNRDLDLSIAGQAPLSKRGKTDVFLARFAPGMHPAQSGGGSGYTETASP